jgi:hypothetical protein
VVEEGGGFPWHFDTNNYTVTLAIQNGEGGGEFEYAPWLRDAADENYAGVEAVLDGRSDPMNFRVKSLALEPGDLQIFKGRYALHRVRPVTGARARYVGIFSFVEEPGMMAKPERCKQLYGRVRVAGGCAAGLIRHTCAQGTSLLQEKCDIFLRGMLTAFRTGDR